MKRFFLMLLLAVFSATTAWAADSVGNLEHCNGVPFGVFVEGWVYYPQSPTIPVRMQVSIYTDADCTRQYGDVQNLTTNVERTDVNSQYNLTGNHGFSTTISVPEEGNYWVKILALELDRSLVQIFPTQQVTVIDVKKEVDLSALTENYVAQHGDKLTGTLPSEIQLSIADGAYVTLADASITTDERWQGILCLGDATIKLVGENNVEQTSHNGFPAIQPGGTGTTLTIRGGGSLTVSSADGAGIGTGVSLDNNIVSCGNIVINSGTITATSQYGAGIGCGSAAINDEYSSMCGDITINSGTITATGRHGAGIGSGLGNTTCGNITINGGNITANGIYQSAGIGCGDAGSYFNNHCGDITITGGNVFAKGFDGNYPKNAPGPGIGSSPTGGCPSGTTMCGNITISGGTVTAIGGQYLPGIGSGDNVNIRRDLTVLSTCGDITISGGVVNAIGGEQAAAIGCGYTTVNGQVCGNITITDGITRIEATSGTGNETGIGYSYANQQCGTLTVDGVEASPSNSLGYVTGGLPHLNVTGGPYWEIYPRNTGDIVFDDDADNTEKLRLLKGVTCNSVKLAGRTLYKDGNWNTLCLPFRIEPTDLANTPLNGATIMYLDVNTKYDSSGNPDNTNGTYQTGLSDGTLYLFFRETHFISAGEPVIVKWEKPNDYVAYDGTNAATCSDIVEPTFNNVTIGSSLANFDFTVSNVSIMRFESKDGKVCFVGTYSPISYSTTNSSILFLGAQNTLYYPEAGANINAFRAYFDLIDASAQVKAFVLNLGNGEETTSIHNSLLTIDNEASGWYDLKGRKLNGTPKTKGIYIANGKKVVIK